MNRSSLAKDIAKKVHLSQRQAENLVIAFGAVVTDALEQGDKVMYSNFGSFYIVEYPSKTINHPKSGKKLVMLPTRVAKFMPSDTLKKMVNNGEDLTQLERMERDLDLESQVEIPISINKQAPEVVEQIPVESEEEIEEIPIMTDSETKDTEKKDEENNEDLLLDTPNPADTPAPPVNESPTPSPHKTDLLHQAHAEDDIETYHQHKVTTGQPSNIYEEILSDGSHEISTVQGAIRLHREKKDEPKVVEKDAEIDEVKDDSKSPLELLKMKLGLSKKTNVEPKSDNHPEADVANEIDQATKPKTNLAGTGIFEKVPSASPLPSQTENPEKIEHIKEELKEGSEDAAKEEQKSDQETEKQTPATPLFSGVEGAFNFDKAKIEYKDLSKVIVPKELLSKIPENIARSYRSVAFEQTEDGISVAMVDPEDIETREMLKRLFGSTVKIFLATESDINSVLNQYQGLETEVSSAIASAEEEDEENSKNDKKKAISADTVSDDAPAAKIVSSLLKRAIRDKASDIHIEPTEKEVEVRFRLDGVLRKKVSLPKDIQPAVISRIKILSNLKIDEQRVPQDGRFNMHVDNRRVDFRVSSMPVAFGEKIVMRILDKDNGILTIEELGVGGSGLKVLDNNITKSHGMVLVTGPTGSGKSTSLYAMIQKVYNEGVNIITLEDPIEYQMRGINQSQVNSDIGYTFAAGLRSILRQDPDIIMLGEIRDKETAEMAVHAALTGHVVLSTLHTNDAAGAAPRMIDMGVEPFLLTSSINVVVGQRLVRKICSECREELKLSDEELAAIQVEIDKMPKAEHEQIMKQPLKFFKGKGCKSCDNSGYKGRIGIYEILGITPEMQQLILKRVSSDELNNLAISQGMVTMIQDGIIKASEGVTTMEEVWRSTKN